MSVCHFQEIEKSKEIKVRSQRGMEHIDTISDDVPYPFAVQRFINPRLRFQLQRLLFKTDPLQSKTVLFETYENLSGELRHLERKIPFHFHPIKCKCDLKATNERGLRPFKSGFKYSHRLSLSPRLSPRHFHIHTTPE